MNLPENLKYSKDHEWVKVENNIAYIGITDYAQNSLGDIVYVELPEEEDEISKGDEVLNIESVKAAAPIYTPLSGKIVKVNEDLDDEPELLNKDAFGNFIFALEISDAGELEELLSASDYDKFLEEE
ncbi:MAG: glycine cleavage system protein GcvH [Spirochaetales bacterium]|nr:glycine cleavage system protein GcvH [Spirochaetales bacterium]